MIRDELTALKEYVISNEDAIRAYAATYYEKYKHKNVNPNDKEIEQLRTKCLQIDNYIQKLFEANVRGDLPQSTYEMMMKKYKIVNLWYFWRLINLLKNLLKNLFRLCMY